MWGRMDAAIDPVSYTHLDVYKRQVHGQLGRAIVDTVRHTLGQQVDDAVVQSEQPLPNSCLLYTSRCV